MTGRKIRLSFLDGLGYLVKEADTKGVKFGIWIEPEMVNPKSELYETSSRLGSEIAQPSGELLPESAGS